MKKRIRFSTPIDVTSPDIDAIKIAFPFTAIDSSLIGSQAEEEETKFHKIIVSISGPQQISWERDFGIEGIDWVKFLFQYCRAYLEEKIKKRSLQESEEIDLSNKECRYDPSKLEDPSGLEILVEEEAPKIGFH